MCNSAILVPIPFHLSDYAAEANGFKVGPEFDYDDQGRACFVVDECIAPALRAVWAAGFRTLGCCCGHGQKSGGIITLDTMYGQPTTDTQKEYARLHADIAASQAIARAAVEFVRKIT